MSSLQLFIFISGFCLIRSIPVVYKGSSPSGDATITVSSSDPAVVKYFASKYPAKFDNRNTASSRNPGNVFSRSFSIAIPGHAAAGSGRSFVSTSFNPYLTPLFFNPINFEGTGLNNFEPINIFKGIESFPDPRFGGSNGISVSAINDNGRVYSNVKTYNNRPKSSRN